MEIDSLDALNITDLYVQLQTNSTDITPNMNNSTVEIPVDHAIFSYSNYAKLYKGYIQRVFASDSFIDIQ